MQKHTPGPWTVTEVGPAPRYMIAGAATSVAMTYGQSGQQADARLIAAAPEMKLALIRLLNEHDALQMAEGSHEDRWSAATIARAILNKIDA